MTTSTVALCTTISTYHQVYAEPYRLEWRTYLALQDVRLRHEDQMDMTQETLVSDTSIEARQSLVYLSHHGHLSTSFLEISLIDADVICPDPQFRMTGCLTESRPQSAQEVG